MSFNQGEFNFNANGSEAGFKNWRASLDKRKRAFESRWGIVLSSPVRVTLTDRPQELEGVIHLIPNKKPSTAQHMRLRLQGVEFTPLEIESLVRMDAPDLTDD
jgi:hypothetical protein